MSRLAAMINFKVRWGRRKGVTELFFNHFNGQLIRVKKEGEFFLCPFILSDRFAKHIVLLKPVYGLLKIFNRKGKMPQPTGFRTRLPSRWMWK